MFSSKILGPLLLSCPPSICLHRCSFIIFFPPPLTSCLYDCLLTMQKKTTRDVNNTWCSRGLADTRRVHRAVRNAQHSLLSAVASRLRRTEPLTNAHLCQRPRPHPVRQPIRTTPLRLLQVKLPVRAHGYTLEVSRSPTVITPASLSPWNTLLSGQAWAIYGPGAICSPVKPFNLKLC